jgi:hypothetical protein
MEELPMEAIQNAEPINATERGRTTLDECPTCISGTDPLILTLGVEILQDPE